MTCSCTQALMYHAHTMYIPVYWAHTVSPTSMYQVHTSTYQYITCLYWCSTGFQFGRGKPRLGGLTIDETFDRQEAARKASDVRRKETRGRRKDGRAWLKMKCECDLNEYVLVHTWYILVQTGLYKVFPKVWREDMFLTLDYGKLYWACGTCILWYPSISTQVHPLKNVHVMQLVHTCM